MRHGPELPPPIRPLAITVLRLACGRNLVSASGCAQLLLPGSYSTWIAAVALTAVTTGADRENYVALGIAAHAQTQTSRALFG